MEFIDKLDSTLTVGDDDYRQYITNALREKLQSGDAGLKTAGEAFLETIDHLLELVYSSLLSFLLTLFAHPCPYRSTISGLCRRPESTRTSAPWA